jgi:CheY-like chemotaxis protein
VGAYSDGPGKGSTFTISLPLSIERGVEETSDATPRVSDEPQGGASNGRAPTRKILVADDNADALESLAMLLELEGHEVYRAADGREACSLAERVRPEVMFLDIGMPHLDGLEVARNVRGTHWGRKTCLVALTGWGQQSDRERSKEAGFDCHLTKPVDYEKINSIIARVGLET